MSRIQRQETARKEMRARWTNYNEQRDQTPEWLQDSAVEVADQDRKADRILSNLKAYRQAEIGLDFEL